MQVIVVQAGYEPNTIAANNGLLKRLIDSQVDVETAKALLSTPYKGYYKISGKIIDKKMTFPNINEKHSFPDSRWTREALDIAKLAKTPISTTGSHISPKATAYVVFYSSSIEGVDRTGIKRVDSYQPGKDNTLAVLVVRHKNHTKSGSTTSNSRSRMGSNAKLTGTNVYFFKLTL